MGFNGPQAGEYQRVPYDLHQKVIVPTCSGTRVYSWVAIIVSTLFSIGCFVFAGIMFGSDTASATSDYDDVAALGIPVVGAQINYPTSLSQVSSEAVAFIINLVVTNCCDALGFVHATSLRWALYRERRLAYNTNLRLLRSAKTSLPNRWFMNFLSAACLILSYASTSVLFMKSYNRGDSDVASVTTYLNPLAVCFLGVGLAGQVLVALLCMRNSRNLIPTWSSNPLVNTLACLQGEDPSIQHRYGRCMLSVVDRHEQSKPRAPNRRQPSLWKIPGIRWIMVSIWLLCILPTIWALIVYSVGITQRHSSHQDFDLSWNEDFQAGVTMSLEPVGNIQGSTQYYSSAVQSILAVLFLFFVQALQAIGLHCMELIINMGRDEYTWNKCSSKSGTQLETNPLTAAVSSWRSIMLVTLKVGLHWLAGQAVSFETGYEIAPMNPAVPLEEQTTVDFYLQPSLMFYMSAARLIAYAIGAAIAAVIVTMLASWPRKAHQPAAWGHLQTLADLVDEWPAPTQKLWWGDKGMVEGGVRHAGTSTHADALGEIDPSAQYAGSLDVSSYQTICRT